MVVPRKRLVSLRTPPSQRGGGDLLAPGKYRELPREKGYQELSKRIESLY